MLKGSVASVKIPPRSEKMVKLKIQSPFEESFCSSREILPGVYVSNGIVKKDNNNFATIGIVNANNYIVDVENITLKTESLTPYKIFTINNWND